MCCRVAVRGGVEDDFRGSREEICVDGQESDGGAVVEGPLLKCHLAAVVICSCGERIICWRSETSNCCSLLFPGFFRDYDIPYSAYLHMPINAYPQLSLLFPLR